VPWAELNQVAPRGFTVHAVPGVMGTSNPWAELMPTPQPLPAGLVDEGRQIPIARVQAMPAGKRRARARHEAESTD
jgi:bifunctional non-homologous end joining protein LigD